MNYFSTILLLFLMSLAPAKTFAYTPKEGNVSAILSPFFYKTKFPGSSSGARSPDLAGTSLLAIGDINDYSSLELGIFYFNKIYFRERFGKYLAEKTQLIHITIGYRYWLTPYLSTSLSFYSAYSLGNIEITHTDFIPSEQPDTSARDKTEYGFDAALQAEPWSHERLALVLDARYSRSVTSREHEDADHYGVAVGIRYFIQEKKKTKAPRN